MAVPLFRDARFHDAGPRDPRPGDAVSRRAGPNHEDPLVIDCASCVGPSFGACDDCVVTFLCDRDPGDAVVIDVVEARALRALAAADLVPHLRHSAGERPG